MQKSLNLQQAIQFGTVIVGMGEAPFKLSSSTVFAFALNLNRVNKAFLALKVDEEVAKIVREEGNPQEGQPGYEKVLQRKIDYNNNTKVEVSLEMIKRADLKIGQGTNDNHIPPQVVAALSPMIEDFGE